MHSNRLLLLLLLPLAGGLLAAAHASAQVVLIDQAKALAGNVTPGDAPGFPITISQPGSYRLGGSLTVDSVHQGAIRVTAPNVTLDLNGLVIRGGRCGPERCTIGPPPTVGVQAEHGNFRLFNGTIENFGGVGVVVRGGALLDQLRVLNNGLEGVDLGGGARLSDSLVSRNERGGVLAAAGRVTGTLVLHNKGYQLRVAGPAVQLIGNWLLGDLPLDATYGAPVNRDNLCNSQAC